MSLNVSYGISELGHPGGRLGASFIKQDGMASGGCHKEADVGLGLLQLPSLVQNRTRALRLKLLPLQSGWDWDGAAGLGRKQGRGWYLGECVQHKSAR